MVATPVRAVGNENILIALPPTRVTGAPWAIPSNRNCTLPEGAAAPVAPVTVASRVMVDAAPATTLVEPPLMGATTMDGVAWVIPTVVIKEFDAL